MNDLNNRQKRQDDPDNVIDKILHAYDIVDITIFIFVVLVMIVVILTKLN